jgi:DNA-binding response OmpR family regulator
LTAREETVKSTALGSIRSAYRGVAVGRMDRWRINLLGRFELRAPDGQEVALGARKSIALLVLLTAAPGQRMSRDQLAALLWEDCPTRRPSPAATVRR